MSSTRKRNRGINLNASYSVGAPKRFTGRLGENRPPILRDPATGESYNVVYPPEAIEKLKEMGTAVSAARTVYHPKYGWPRLLKTNKRTRGDPNYNRYFRERERHSKGVRNHGNWKITSPAANSPNVPPGFGVSALRGGRKTRRLRR